MSAGAHERTRSFAAYAVQFGLLGSQGLIFISLVRGSSWAANFGYPLVWKGSGAAGKRPQNKIEREV